MTIYMESYKLCVLGVDGGITDTLVFGNADSDIKATHSYIHPDDSIRTIKMKILHELHNGEHADTIKLRPCYEEMYLYAFVKEDTSTLKLFDALKTENEPDPMIPLDLIKQMLEGHPKSKKIIRKIRDITDKDAVEYSRLEDVLSEARTIISVKTPLGVQFAGGRRNPTFETDPFSVEKYHAHLTEHSDLHHFESSLLLNYGEIVDNTIYMCLASRVYESTKPESEEYIARYYFPGLYSAGISSNEQLAGKRGALLKKTASLLTDARQQHYQSIQTFYEIGTDSEPTVEYLQRGIKHITIRLIPDAYSIGAGSADHNVKSLRSGSHARNLPLEMLFKNLHARKSTPYIKFNPGNRREHIYRFYFERITRTGKKIPYLSRAQIMRMTKTAGKSQQISIYLEGVAMKDRRVSSCFLHFESTGNIQLQFAFSVPIDERTVDSIITETVVPYLNEIGNDIRPIGFAMPEYAGMRALGRTQIISMDFVVKTPAKKYVTWNTVPCIFSICTVHSEPTKGRQTSHSPPLVARLKRVENFREMDAARILVTELYGQVQYGDLSLQDIVAELTARNLVETEDAARILIADVLNTTNEMDGEIVERPGFPMQMEIDNEDHTLQIVVSDITSAYYLDTVSVYLDAIVKTTQLYKENAPLLKQLNRSCKKARKFEEVREDEIVSPASSLRDAIRAPATVAAPLGPAVFSNLDDDEFFAQFDSEEEEDEEYRAPGKIHLESREDAEDDENAIHLLGRLRANVNNAGPITFESDDEDAEESSGKAKSTGEPRNKPVSGPILFESDEEEEEEEESGEEKKPAISSAAPNLRREDKASENKEKKTTEEPVSVPTLAPYQPQPLKSTTTQQPILFYDSEEEEAEPETQGGAKRKDPPPAATQESDADEDPVDYDEHPELVPDGVVSLKPDNPILRRLKKRDPELFMTKSKGKYKGFSVSCQPTSRHPVILTKDELDKTDPESYEHVIKYGSDPKNQHYFICPRFWCMLTNSAISPEDVKKGKCGKIIPKGAEVVPKGAYVYELNSEITQYPGFREDTRADGKCLPCCFSAPWDSKKQRDARARCSAQMAVSDENPDADHTTGAKQKQPPKKKTAVDKKTAQYIISLDTFPVPEKRWGFLPIPVQLFLNIDYRPAMDPGNPALLQPNKPVLLRYGVEQPDQQSFLGCFAHIYAHRQGLDKVPTVAEFRKTLTEIVTIDVFVRLHNGSLLSTFYPKKAKETAKVKLGKEIRAKYENTEFAAGLNVSTDKSHARYFDDAILSYENFIAYLNSPETTIDHRYLWDLVCEKNSRISPNGLNLVIMEIKANDMIDRIELVCPTNLYSSNQFDSAKDTVILLKHDDYYEPVFLYESAPAGAGEPKVVRFFEARKLNRNIANVLKNVELATRKYCPGMPSLPTIYKFASPVPITQLMENLDKIGAKITSQVSNYQGKTIGLMVMEKEHKGAAAAEAVYLPCAPSARLSSPLLPIHYMDDTTILNDYEKTTATLNRISTKTGIPCRPIRKIKEGGLVVGFLTETNQFVPIKPNEDIIMDGLRVYEGLDIMAADKTVATTNKTDRTREKMTKYIVLESQFYHAFRNRVRILMNEFGNRSIMRQIRKIAEDPTLLYSQKIGQIEPLLKTLIEHYVIFVKIDKTTLMDMAAVNECEDADDASPNCIIKENDGIAQLAIPNKHLISKHDNKPIYVGRLADELVRNQRVQLFMYDTANRLNARNVDYDIREDEFVLVKSALTPEYFVEIDAAGEYAVQYPTRTNYETANPSISVVYPNERIPLEEQYQAPKLALEEESTHDCLVNVVPIIGNKKQLWKRIFPDTAREWIFRATAHCTFQPIMRIAETVLQEKWTPIEIKRRLCSGYMNLFAINSDYLKNVVAIMRIQGKSKMFERFVRAKSELTPESFEAIVVSDDYYLSDIDYWVIADQHKLPIILFNPNSLKGFFPKTDVKWLKLGGNMSADFHFVRSNVGSFATHIYEYNLIVPAMSLKKLKEFETEVEESLRDKTYNTHSLEYTLSRIVVQPKTAIDVATAKK